MEFQLPLSELLIIILGIKALLTNTVIFLYIDIKIHSSLLHELALKFE